MAQQTACMWAQSTNSTSHSPQSVSDRVGGNAAAPSVALFSTPLFACRRGTRQQQCALCDRYTLYGLIRICLSPGCGVARGPRFKTARIGLYYDGCYNREQMGRWNHRGMADARVWTQSLDVNRGPGTFCALSPIEAVSLARLYSVAMLLRTPRRSGI